MLGSSGRGVQVTFCLPVWVLQRWKCFLQLTSKFSLKFASELCTHTEIHWRSINTPRSLQLPALRPLTHPHTTWSLQLLLAPGPFKTHRKHTHQSLLLLFLRSTSPVAHSHPSSWNTNPSCKSLHVLVPRSMTCGLFWPLAHSSLLQVGLSSFWPHFPPVFLGSFDLSPKLPIVISFCESTSLFW